jgi:hypothetical protein
VIDYYDARRPTATKVSVFDVEDYVRLRLAGNAEVIADMPPKLARRLARSLWNAARAAEGPSAS